jgi:hypothetical protein
VAEHTAEHVAEHTEEMGLPIRPIFNLLFMLRLSKDAVRE